MTPQRDRDRAELRLRRAVLVHVAPGDGGEVDGLREPAERNLEVLLEQLLGVRLAGPADHASALRRPRDRERVDDAGRLSVPQRLSRVVGCGAGPHHPTAAVRLPHVVRRPEVVAERGRVERVGERGDVHDAVDVGRREPGVGQRPLDGLAGDLDRGPAGRARVIGLAHSADGDLAGDVLQLVGEAPVDLPHRAGTAVPICVSWSLRSSAPLRFSLIGSASSRR